MTARLPSETPSLAPPALRWMGNGTLLDILLEEQGQLTAVDRFIRDQGVLEQDPAQARYYRALIPLEKPKPGEQYAFFVDLDSCSGCKACVSACHSLNGLDDHETWRSTGLLHGGTLAQPYQQVVTSACHHCVDPACLNGCPVLAYEKDPLTGIVRHLDDQCIGCQYCILKCPYDVPTYSAKRGIVRKCDMCHSRLEANEAPACVQACPSEAIRIRVVSQDATTEAARNEKAHLLPGTVWSGYTQPTTCYSTRRGMPENAQPADSTRLQKEPAHWPLIWMLVLTQWAAGIVLAAFLMLVAQPGTSRVVTSILTRYAGGLLVAGLASSVFHLGRPLGAWRAFLGWRRSWMSREILAFGAFSGATLALVIAATLPDAGNLVLATAGLTALLGIVSVFCSGMIYVDTRRPFWQPSRTFPKFFGTMLQSGAATLAVLLSLPLPEGSMRTVFLVVGGFAIVSRGVLLVLDGWTFAVALEDSAHPLHRSMRLLWDQCRGLLWFRGILFAVAGTANVGGFLATGTSATAALTLALLATFASHLVERYCYFVAVEAPRMPGGFAA